MISFGKRRKRSTISSSLHEDLGTMRVRDPKDAGLERYNQRLFARTMASVQ